MQKNEVELLGTWSARDAVVALLFVAASLLLFWLTAQARLTIDGAGLASMAATGTGRGYYNILYLPVVRAVAALLPGAIDPEEVRAASSLFGAIAVGSCYLVVRRFRITSGPAAVATGLWALSPGLWFYATTVETHAVHAGVAGLVTLIFLSLPWSRPRLALALAAGLMPILLWTQQVSIFLGPGLVLLADLARRRTAQGFGSRRLLLVVGPTLLAGFVVGLLGANLYRFGQFTPSVEGQMSQILFDKGTGDTWWTEWLSPFGVLEGLVLLGLLLPRGLNPLGKRARWCLLALILPAILFFSWWGVFERGGYFLGSAPFHVVLAAAGLQAVGRTRPWPLVAAILLAFQAWLGLSTLRAHDTGWIPSERVAQVRAAIGETGLLISTTNIAPSLALGLPKADEVALWEACKQAMIQSEGTFDPRDLTPWVLRRIERELRSGRRVALELGYREADPVHDDRPYFDGLDAIVGAIEERFDLNLIEHPHWPMAVIEERTTAPTGER